MNKSPRKIMNISNSNINSNNNSNDKSYYFYLKKSSQVTNQNNNNDSSFNISKGPVSYRPTQKFNFDERKNSNVSGGEMSPQKFRYYLDSGGKKMMTDMSIMNDDISKESALDISTSNPTKYIKSNFKDSQRHSAILNMTATNNSIINTSTMSTSIIGSSKKPINLATSTIVVTNTIHMKPSNDNNNIAERSKHTINKTSTQAVYNKIYESKSHFSNNNEDTSSLAKLSYVNKRPLIVSNTNSQLNTSIKNNVSTNNITPYCKTNNLNNNPHHMKDSSPVILLQNIVNNEAKSYNINSRRPSQNLDISQIKDEEQNNILRKFSKNDESNIKFSSQKDRMPLGILETNNNYEVNYPNNSDDEDGVNIKFTRKSLEARSKQVTSISEFKGYSHHRERTNNVLDNTNFRFLVDNSLFKDKLTRVNDVGSNVKQNSPVFDQDKTTFFMKNQSITPVNQEQSNNKEKEIEKMEKDRSNSNKNSHQQKNNTSPRHFRQIEALTSQKKDALVENSLLKKKQEKLNGTIYYYYNT